MGARRRYLLLQEHLHAANTRLGVEALDHDLVLQAVDQREHNHALMVGHIRADNGMRPAPASGARG